MELFVTNAFTSERFGGNPAGVVPLGGGAFPPAPQMRQVAAFLRHSETVYIRRTGAEAFSARYFTPADEVALCGHATIAAFATLRSERGLVCGDYTLETNAGVLRLSVGPDAIWMDMAPGRVLRTLSGTEALPFYEALGLGREAAPETLPPCVVSAGLADLLLPVRDYAALAAAELQRDALRRLSETCSIVGAHLFCLGGGTYTARCRNFAPLYDINEECATGTANAALTHYLLAQGHIRAGQTQRFLQGEAMGRPSVVLSKTDSDGRIRIGGNAIVMLAGTLR